MANAVRHSKSLSVVIVAMMVLTLLYSRGMLLGNGQENIALVASLVAIFLCILIRPEKCKTPLLITCLLFFSYCFIQPYLLGSGNYSKVNQFYIWWVVPTVATCVALSIPKIQRWFTNVIIFGLCTISLSYIVTFLLSLVVGWDALRISVIDYNYYYDAPLLFPFTIVYGSGSVGGMTIWRLLGLARESGIMQMLFAWAYFVSDGRFRFDGIVKVLLTIGVLVCLSTTGLALFVGAILLKVLVNRQSKFLSFNSFFIVIIVVLVGWILLGSGSYGISNRMSVSYVDRSVAMDYSTRYLKQAPLFGVGFMSLPENAGVQWNICLLGSAGQIGYVGLFLFFLTYVVGFFSCKSPDGRKYFLFANLSFFLTTVLSQPLFYSGLIYMFLFFDYDEFGRMAKSAYCKRNGNQIFGMNFLAQTLDRGDSCE